MTSEENALISKINKNQLNKNTSKNEYSIKEAIKEFDELKNIALNCYDKNGNPNILAAIRAAENKAKIAGLYSKENKAQVSTFVKMGEITIDGEQLKLNIGEEFLNS